MKGDKSNVYDEYVLNKIQTCWFSYRRENKVTQAQAAEQLGMKQSAFSQYLCGNIALNAEFISRFAQMVKRSPAYFHQRLDSGGEEWESMDSTIFTAEVSQTLSQGKVSTPFVLMPRMAIIRGYVNVEIDNFDTRYPRGTIVFFMPDGKICETDEVGVFGNDGRIIAIGELEYGDNHWRVSTLKNGIPTKVILMPEHRLMRLQGSIQHEKTRKRLFSSKALAKKQR